MAAQVVSFFRQIKPSYNWTQRELAEFYRVEGALIQAGLRLETDRGVTDEGDPWFVFCHLEGGDVFIHFARINGEYIAVGASLERVVRGNDFPALVQEMLNAPAFSMAKARNHSNIFLHPTALLIALVGGAFFHSNNAKAAELSRHGQTDLRGFSLPILVRDTGEQLARTAYAGENATILSSVLIGLNSLAPFGSANAAAPIVPSSVAAADLVTRAPVADIVGPTSIETPAPTSSALDNDLGTPQISSELAFPHQAYALSYDAAFSPLTPNIVVEQHSDLAVISSALASIAQSAPVIGASGLPLQLAGTTAAAVIESPSVFAYFMGANHPSTHKPPPSDPGSADSSHSSETPSAPPSPTDAPHVVAPIAPAINETSGGSTTSTDLPHITPPAATITETLGGSDSVTVGLALSETVPAQPNLNQQVTAEVAHFAAEAITLDVGNSGSEVIFYDGALLSQHPGASALESLTFHFADGSSICLVGTTAEISNLHLA